MTQCGCLCRTIRFWDLEKFQVVSCIEGEPGPVRYVGSQMCRWVMGRLAQAPGSGTQERVDWPHLCFSLPPSAKLPPGFLRQGGGPGWVPPDPQPPLSWPRSVLFNPDGCCLYSGCQDSLRVYGWEPERCFDVVLVNWGKVADLAICNDQLVRGPQRLLPTFASGSACSHPAWPGP